MTDWYDIRKQARRDIHTAFRVEANYTDQANPDPVNLYVRWHQRMGPPIGVISRDYSGVLETVDRIIFDIDELAAKGVTPRRGGSVELVKYEHTVRLANREPSSGPVEETWTVSA